MSLGVEMKMNGLEWMAYEGDGEAEEVMVKIAAREAAVALWVNGRATSVSCRVVARVSRSVRMCVRVCVRVCLLVFGGGVGGWVDSERVREVVVLLPLSWTG